jgi:hypothetical protein
MMLTLTLALALTRSIAIAIAMISQRVYPRICHIPVMRLDHRSVRLPHNIFNIILIWIFFHNLYWKIRTIMLRTNTVTDMFFTVN